MKATILELSAIQIHAEAISRSAALAVIATRVKRGEGWETSRQGRTRTAVQMASRDLARLKPNCDRSGAGRTVDSRDRDRPARGGDVQAFADQHSAAVALKPPITGCPPRVVVIQSVAGDSLPFSRTIHRASLVRASERALIASSAGPNRTVPSTSAIATVLP